MRATRGVLAAAVALGTALSAAAQTQNKPGPTDQDFDELRIAGEQDFDALALEELLNPEDVTTSIASHRPLSPDLAPGLVTVFRAEQIRSMGVRTLRDLLRFVPGFDLLTDNLGRSRVVYRGIMPAAATGGGSDGVLLMFNGHRLNDGLNGGATAVNYDIALDNVRQVEVLRGPGASLFGDAALVAVVNVVSETTDDLVGSELGAGLGSYWTQQYTLRSSSVLKDLKVSGFVRFDDTNGARLPIDVDTQTLADNGSGTSISLAPGRTTDQLRALETSYRASFRKFDLSWRTRRENTAGFVGVVDSLGRQNDLNNRQVALDAGWNGAAGRLGNVQVRLNYTQSELRQLLEVHPSGFTVSTEDGGFIRFGDPGVKGGGVFIQTALNVRRFGVETLLERQIGSKHDLVAGLSLETESTFDLQANGNLDFRTGQRIDVEENGLGPLPDALPDRSRGIFGLHVQDTWTPSAGFAVTAGLRLDRHSDSGGSLNPRLGVVWALPRDLRLKLLYGRSYRAPTFGELFFTLPGYSGRSDLRPSTADTVQAVLSLRRQDVEVDGTVYVSLLRDLIVPQAPYSPLGYSVLANGGGVNARGFELEVRRTFKSGSAFLTYTFQHPHDRATGRRVAEVPAHLASLGATFNVRDRYSVTPTLVLRSSRARAPGDSRADVDGYGVLDVTAVARNVYKSVGLSLTLGNLFDVDYCDPSPIIGVPGDYPRPGRRILVQATVRF
jgi:iron complex outermembrane receptor protein